MGVPSAEAYLFTEANSTVRRATFLYMDVFVTLFKTEGALSRCGMRENHGSGKLGARSTAALCWDPIAARKSAAAGRGARGRALPRLRCPRRDREGEERRRQG